MRRREAFWEPRGPSRHARKYLHPPSTDPDGHRWEIFVVTQADAAVHSTPAAMASATHTLR